MYDDDYDDEDDYGTIPCPNCGEDVYDDSPRCPQCGEYITSSSRRSSKPIWVQYVFVIVVILTILSFMLPSLLGLF